MAFLANDPNQQQNQQSQTTGQVIPTLQGAGGPSTGSANTSGTATSAPAKSPGAAPSQPWQNITTYLSANAPQTQDLTNKITGNLTGQFNTAKGAIDTGAQNFTNQVNSAAVPENQNLLNQAVSNPTEFVKNAQNVTDFQKMLHANYAGPSDFTTTGDYSNAQNAIQKVSGIPGLIEKGTPGYETLLQGFEKNPTAGMTALDALLLQQNPNSSSQLKAAAAPFSGLTNYLSQQGTNLNTLASNAAQSTAKTAQDVNSAFSGNNGVIPSLQGTLQNQFQNATQQYQNAVNQAQNNTSLDQDIVSRLGNLQNITPEEASYLNIQPNAIKNIIDSYFTSINRPQTYRDLFTDVLSQQLKGAFSPSQANNVLPTIQNTATPEQYAEIAALNQLLGDNEFQGFDLGQSNQAGGFQSSVTPGKMDQNTLNTILFQAQHPGGSIPPELTPPPPPSTTPILPNPFPPGGDVHHGGTVPPELPPLAAGIALESANNIPQNATADQLAQLFGTNTEDFMRQLHLQGIR